MLTAFAAVIGLSPNKTMKILPSKTNKGAPGGWGICTLKQLLTNSPQSQKLPPASLVIIYTVQANKHIAHPAILLIRLNFIFKKLFVDDHNYLIEIFMGPTCIAAMMLLFRPRRTLAHYVYSST